MGCERHFSNWLKHADNERRCLDHWRRLNRRRRRFRDRRWRHNCRRQRLTKRCDRRTAFFVPRLRHLLPHQLGHQLDAVVVVVLVWLELMRVSRPQHRRIGQRQRIIGDLRGWSGPTLEVIADGRLKPGGRLGRGERCLLERRVSEQFLWNKVVIGHPLVPADFRPHIVPAAGGDHGELLTRKFLSRRKVVLDGSELVQRLLEFQRQQLIDDLADRVER